MGYSWQDVVFGPGGGWGWRTINSYGKGPKYRDPRSVAKRERQAQILVDRHNAALPGADPTLGSSATEKELRSAQAHETPAAGKARRKERRDARHPGSALIETP